MLPSRRGRALRSLSHSQIGVKDGQRPHVIQQPLPACCHRPAQKGPAKRLPGTPTVAQFQIIPDRVVPILPPLTGLRLLRQGLQFFIDAAAADIADLQLFKALKQILVKKAGVHPHDNGHFLAVMLADEPDDMLDHFHGGIPMVAVFAAAPEHGVDDQAFPGQLQGLKAVHLFIRRLDPMPLLGLIIIHHHRVHAQDHNFGLLNLQPPKEQLLQQRAEQPDTEPGEGTKKSFHRMGREHMFRGSLNGPGISLIFFQIIKVDQVTAGAIQQEAENLLEDLGYRLALGILADGAEKTFQDRINGYVSEISDKQGQAAPGGQGVRSCFHSINNVSFFISTSHSSACDDLSPTGFG